MYVGWPDRCPTALVRTATLAPSYRPATDVPAVLTETIDEACTKSAESWCKYLKKAKERRYNIDARPGVSFCTPTPIAFDPDSIDLTGAWAGDDGGIYYVRQLDSVIWWNGMSSRDEEPDLLGREWNNVGRGEIGEDLTIASEWADVPRGGAEGGGTVDFKIGADSEGNLEITKTGGTGSGRGDTVWTPCEPGFPQ